MRNAPFFRIMKPDGISILILMIALLLLSGLAVVLSALIITKQKAAVLPFRSTQAFYVAQAGIEYAIRYTCDHQAFWTDPGNIFPVTKSLGAGGFNITYDAGNRSITSTGQVGTAKREVSLASFPGYVAGEGITLEPGNPPFQGAQVGEQKGVYVPTLNNYHGNVYIFRVDLAKEGGTQARLNTIGLGGTTVWTGNKVDVSADHNSPTSFPFNQVSCYNMAPGALTDRIEVQATAEVSGRWYLTFHYSKQADLSGPETSALTFVIS